MSSHAKTVDPIVTAIKCTVMDRLTHLWPDIAGLVPGITSPWHTTSHCTWVSGCQITPRDETLPAIRFRVACRPAGNLMLCTAMTLAVINGNLPTLQFLSTRNAVEARACCDVLLCQAVVNGQLTICQFLATLGPTRQVMQHHGKHMLAEAARRGHTDTCHFMNKLGVSLDGMDNVESSIHNVGCAQCHGIIHGSMLEYYPE